MQLRELFEEAYEQAGIPFKTGYDVRTIRRSLELLSWDWDNRGLNFWRIYPYENALESGVPSVPLTTGTVDLLDISVKDGATGSEIPLNRIDIGEYQSKPNKSTPGRPVDFFVLRNAGNSVVYYWQVPDKSTYIVTGWRMATDDVSAPGDGSAPVPFRFMPALVAGLAYEIGKKHHPREVSDGKLMQLKSDYDEKWLHAEKGDAQRASIWMRPNMGGY